MYCQYESFESTCAEDTCHMIVMDDMYETHGDCQKTEKFWTKLVDDYDGEKIKGLDVFYLHDPNIVPVEPPTDPEVEPEFECVYWHDTAQWVDYTAEAWERFANESVLFVGVKDVAVNDYERCEHICDAMIMWRDGTTFRSTCKNAEELMKL